MNSYKQQECACFFLCTNTNVLIIGSHARYSDSERFRSPHAELACPKWPPHRDEGSMAEMAICLFGLHSTILAHSDRPFCLSAHARNCKIIHVKFFCKFMHEIRRTRYSFTYMWPPPPKGEKKILLQDLFEVVLERKRTGNRSNGGREFVLERKRTGNRSNGGRVRAWKKADRKQIGGREFRWIECMWKKE